MDPKHSAPDHAPARRRWTVLECALLAGLVINVAGLVGLQVDSPWAEVDAGPVLATGAVGFPTVAVRNLSVSEAAWARLHGAVLTDRLEQGAVAAARAQASASAEDAGAAAAGLLGHPSPRADGLVQGDWGGPSAGLAMALALVDAADGSQGDLEPAGLEVAATGAVHRDGSLGSVGGLEHKLAGVADRGGDVLLVEASTLGAAGVPEGIHQQVRVVAVDSLQEAVGWLCAAGAADQICDQVGRDVVVASR